MNNPGRERELGKQSSRPKQERRTDTLSSGLGPDPKKKGRQGGRGLGKRKEKKRIQHEKSGGQKGKKKSGRKLDVGKKKGLR